MKFPLTTDEVDDIIEGYIDIYQLYDDIQGGRTYFDVLYEYYIDEMPYGVAKARTSDPAEWIFDKLERFW